MTHDSLIMTPSTVLGHPQIQDNDDGTVTVYFSELRDAWITLVSREHCARIMQAAATADSLLIRRETQVAAVTVVAEQLTPLPEDSPAKRCCDLHGRNCEPPSELCCEQCTEADHPWHTRMWPCSNPDFSSAAMVPGETPGQAPSVSHETAGPGDPPRGPLAAELLDALAAVDRGEVEDLEPWVEPLPERGDREPFICMPCQFGECTPDQNGEGGCHAQPGTGRVCECDHIDGVVVEELEDGDG
jgi:hypothetical protein